MGENREAANLTHPSAPSPLGRTRLIQRLRGSLRYFGTGVADQVLLSGASFIAGFVMIRFTSDVDYGQFVLAQSAIALLISAQSAWLCGPVTTLAPHRSPEDRKLLIGAVRASQARALRWALLITLVLDAVCYFAGICSVRSASVAALTAVAGWAALDREYLRAILLIYSRPHSMLKADAVYAGVFSIGIGVAAFAPGAALCAIAGLTAAYWAGGRTAHSMLASDPGWVEGDARPFWPEINPLGSWALVGAVIYWLFAQSYNYVLAARLDLSAVASVNASRLVMQPVFVFNLGINILLMPIAANWLADLGLPRMLRRLAALSLGVLILDCCYFVIVWVIRDWLVGDFLHKSIMDRDRLLVLWACVASIFIVREVLQAALYALKQVRSMAGLVGLSAIVALSLMWFGISHWGATAVLIGQVAGECVYLLGLLVLLWITARRRLHSGQVGPRSTAA
jgi:O-antigen/teichoic acid export membrane protein